MRPYACRIGWLFLVMLALATLCPWVPVVGQSGGSGGNALVSEDNLFNFFVDPFADSFTDHYYEVVTSEHLTWAEAEAAAESRTFLGVQGHLATLTSEQESHFVGLQAAFILDSGDHWELDGGSCWVGGYQLEGSTEPDGGWQWVTGEPWDYTDWATGEPDDVTGEQKYLMLFGDPQPVSVVVPYPDGSVGIIDYLPEPWNWDDSADTLAPYVVEYEPPTLAEVVGTVEKFIQDLPDEAFDRNPQQRRRQLADQLAQVKRMFSYGNGRGAGRKLAFDILPRVGGGRLVSFGGLPSRKSDWIVDGDAQEQLGTLIGDLVKACKLHLLWEPHRNLRIVRFLLR